MYLRQNLNPINGKPSTKIKKLNGRRPWRMDCGLQSHLNPVGRGGGATLGRGVGAVWSRQLSPVVEGPAGASCRGHQSVLRGMQRRVPAVLSLGRKVPDGRDEEREGKRLGLR
jgi:hypothetical protein